MKMKSKLFSLNAKLALAVLAVSTMFASCYDSENGDVTKPYTPLPAAYYVAGTITDLETGEALNDVSVSVNGADPKEFNGYYSSVAKEGLNTITFELAGYNTVTREVDIEKISDGQSFTAVVSVAMSKIKDPVEPELEVSVNMKSTWNSLDNVINSTTGENQDLQLDLIAEDEPFTVDNLKFQVEVGANKISQTPAEGQISEEFAAWINKYIGEQEGALAEATISVPYVFTIPTWNWLKAIHVLYVYENRVYTFTTNGENPENCVVEINRISSHQFSAEFELNHNFSHSHGHGHGHGDGNVNAGGGILTPEM